MQSQKPDCDCTECTKIQELGKVLFPNTKWWLGRSWFCKKQEEKPPASKGDSGGL